MTSKSMTNRGVARRKPIPPREAQAGIDPAEERSIKRLVHRAAGAIRKCSIYEQKAAASLYEAGEYLAEAKEKCGPRNWSKFLREYGVHPTTDWEARELYKRAGSKAAIEFMSKAEALLRFKVRRPKKAAAPSAMARTAKQAERETDEEWLTEMGEAAVAEDRDNDEDVVDVDEPDPALTECDGGVDTESRSDDAEVEREGETRQDEVEPDLEDSLLSLIGDAISSLAKVEELVKGEDLDHDFLPTFEERIKIASNHLWGILKVIKADDQS
jgi:hypothetical protein